MSQKLHNAVLQLRAANAALRVEMEGLRREIAAIREEMETSYQRKRGPKPNETDGQRTARPV